MSHARPRRRIALIALTVVLALVLTSCFGEDEDAEESTTTTSAAQAAPQPTPTTPAAPPEPVPVTVAPAPPPEPVPVTVAPAPPEPPPPPPEAPTEPPVGPDDIVLYTVQAGDTLFSIAQRFGVSLDDVVEANNITNPDVIYEGDTLTIPPAG